MSTAIRSNVSSNRHLSNTVRRRYESLKNSPSYAKSLLEDNYDYDSEDKLNFEEEILERLDNIINKLAKLEKALSGSKSIVSADDQYNELETNIGDSAFDLPMQENKPLDTPRGSMLEDIKNTLMSSMGMQNISDSLNGGAVPQNIATPINTSTSIPLNKVDDDVPNIINLDWWGCVT